MSDIFDLLGDSSKKKKAKQENAAQQDDLDFLGGFKEKVKSGDYSSRKADKDQEGVTPLDIANLPEDQKQIMFMMLRDQQAKREGLSLSDIESRIGADVQSTIAKLVKENWLIIVEQQPEKRYRVNLKRRRSRLSNNLWSALED